MIGSEVISKKEIYQKMATMTKDVFEFHPLLPLHTIVTIRHSLTVYRHCRRRSPFTTVYRHCRRRCSFVTGRRPRHRVHDAAHRPQCNLRFARAEGRGDEAELGDDIVPETRDRSTVQR